MDVLEHLLKVEERLDNMEFMLKQLIERERPTNSLFTVNKIQSNNDNSDLKKMLRDIQIRVHNSQDRIYDLLYQGKVFDEQTKMFLWAILKTENLTYEETKKSFFENLPKANGVMKIKQELTYKLLCKVDSLCRENDLVYWLEFGTLLGAKRHQGFIPWDDDIDIGMMRSDVEKLKEFVKNDSEICILNEYSIMKNSTCNIFRVMFKDKSCPVFMDVFVYDYCKNVTDVCWNEYKKIREEFCKKTEQYSNRTDEVTKFSNSKDAVIRAIIDEDDRKKKIDFELEKTIKKLDDFLQIQNDVEKAELIGLVWGIDNFTLLKRKGLFTADMIFPLREIQFENRMFYAPNKLENILLECYGDIYKLPFDILSHEHLKLDKSEEKLLLKFYNEKLGNY